MNAVGAAPPGTSGPSPALRVTTASGTDVSTLRPGLTASGSGSGRGAAPAPAVVAGGGMPLIADDPSVLQTPSHAVLYHLCTSSIRDKMIAVGASTRYRQKYLTTVYYKPAVVEEEPQAPLAQEPLQEDLALPDPPQ
ncbi:hypothetical protein B0H15DRAFT_788801 [Mycena belliarum]|uniref:Association with the SNF1 complex (ASC) domain-containing protein n=1 Tax=Mycena belliarum TaxID=1033014 RepID=A0AAD6TUE7_9AGAR|nr:hypothetical protein B0H15DRAFT_788801 [Mycena belliae]